MKRARSDDSWIYDKIAGLTVPASAPVLDLCTLKRREDPDIEEVRVISPRIRQSVELQPGLTVILVSATCHDIKIREAAVAAGAVKPRAVSLSRALELSVVAAPAPASFTAIMTPTGFRAVSSLSGVSSDDSTVTLALVKRWAAVTSELARGVTAPLLVEAVDSRLDDDHTSALCVDIASAAVTHNVAVIATSLSRSAAVKSARSYQLAWASGVGHVITDIE